jgi:transcriptional regulator with XRE-family HTH domain
MPTADHSKPRPSPPRVRGRARDPVAEPAEARPAAVAARARPTRPPATPIDEGLRIGGQLRHYRLLRKLKLRELSERAGCSESLLSRIENNQINPSFSSLHRICKALDISVSKLMSSGLDAPCIVLEPGERPVVGRGAPGNPENSEAEVFIPYADGRLLEGVILVLNPGGHSDGFLIHEGEEAGYVIAGQLELVVEDRTYRLGPGATFFLRSDIPHAYRNPGRVTTRVVWINTPPSF